MITFSEAQIAAWLSPLIWPFVRVLALFTTAPVFSQKAIPMRLKVGLAFLVALCAQPMLGEQPVVSIASAQALGTLVQQVVIGLSVGFAVRLVMAAIEVAGEVVGLQMGLNFASFFDPTSNAQLSAVARFMVQIATLLFIVINGHLLVLMAVLKSFEASRWMAIFCRPSRRCAFTRWAVLCLPVPSGLRCLWWRCCCSSTWCWASSLALRRR